MNMPLAAAPAAVDLDAYFARVGYDGPRTPTLATLCALHELHPAAIPFEAIDVLLDRRIDLSAAAVDAKLIAARRGGYCFEQNGLFMRVLRTLGFVVEGLAARVRWNLPADAPPTPSTHMVLRVSIDGEDWLADVGFGGCVPTSPLLMHSRAQQRTQHEAFRLVPQPHGASLLELHAGADWLPVYVLSQEPMHDADYELRNWYTSTHPRSHFRHELVVARTTPQARHTLRNSRYTVRTPAGEVDQQILDADGIVRVLVEDFRLPLEPAWQAVIERAAGRH